jgi:hypothetical protein
MKTPAFAASFLALASLLSTTGQAPAQSGDTPPIDLNQLREALRTLKTEQAQIARSRREQVFHDVRAAAASGSAAGAAWEEAVRRMYLDAAGREGPQFRDWKEKNGSALNQKEAQNAARLYFSWLALTLQRALGVPAKEILPQVVAHTQELTAHEAVMAAFQERAKHAKELIDSGRQRRDKNNNDDAVMKLHDQILKRPLAAGSPAQAYNLGPLLDVENWETTPGNYDGIFQKIILPELRASRDPRLIEYWEMKLKREEEEATRSRLATDMDKFTRMRRPQLLWQRAQDLLLIGQRNRAYGEMFNLVKTHSAHPDAAEWIRTLEELLSPAASPSPSPAG